MARYSPRGLLDGTPYGVSFNSLSSDDDVPSHLSSHDLPYVKPLARAMSLMAPALAHTVSTAPIRCGARMLAEPALLACLGIRRCRPVVTLASQAERPPTSHPPLLQPQEQRSGHGRQEVSWRQRCRRTAPPQLNWLSCVLGSNKHLPFVPLPLCQHNLIPPQS